MKKSIKQILTTSMLAASLFLSTATFAQVPQKFNYQGIARDQKGNPMGKQQMSLKLSVLPTADATVPEYEETQIVTTNEFGLYTLQIGNGTAVTGQMKFVKWETGNKYIKVAIDPKGGTDYVDMGTNQLLSVPYAMYADKAGIAGSQEPGDKATRAAVSTATTPSLFGFITKFNGSAPDKIDNSDIYQNNNPAKLIGIGTVNPLTKLHVQSPAGTGKLELRLQKENGEPRLMLVGDNLSTVGIGSLSNVSFLSKLRDQSAVPGTALPIVPTPLYSPGFPQDRLCVFGNTQGGMVFNTSENFGVGNFNQPLNTNTTNLFIEGPSGKTGIRTTAPNAQLDVNGTGQATGVHAVANQQTVAQTQTAITGAMGATSPFVEAIAIFGEAKATGVFPNGNNVGVAGSAVLATSPQNNIGVMGEAGNAPGYNTAISGTIVQGANPYFENAAIRGYAPNPTTNVFPITNSYAGIFDGRVAVRDGSQSNNFVFTSDPAGAGTWMDPSTNPLLMTGLSSNFWSLTGNAGTTVGTNFLGTTDNTDLMFKRNNVQAGLLGSTNTSLGESSLPLSTTGTYNTAVGVVALQANTTGDFNEAFGFRSLYSNTTGGYNSAFGTRSLNGNTTGSQNIAVGHNAMELNNSGNDNVAVGFQSLYSNSTSNDNTAIGKQALFSNTAPGNTAVGANALFSNTTGIHHTAVGLNALMANTIGTENIAVGEDALTTNTTGAENVAVGVAALKFNNGSYNTALGHAAMESNTTGIENVGVGLGALNKNTTGQWNTAVGENAMFFNTGGQQNTALGKNALTNIQTDGNTAVGYNALNTDVAGVQNTAVGLNSMQLANGGNYSTAIGMYSLRTNQGDFNTGLGWKSLQVNTTGTQNDAVGVQALGSNTSGGQNVAMGHNSLYNNVSGTLNTAIGYRAGEGSGVSPTKSTSVGANAKTGSNSVNATAIGANAFAPNNNTVILGSINGVNGATADTWTGIGTGAPTSTLHVQGSYSHAFRYSLTTGADNLTDLDHVVYITAGFNPTIVLPAASASNLYREYIIVNQTGGPITMPGFWNLFSCSGCPIPPNSSITVMSDGTSWVQIR
jgi:hypothetical protein